MIIHFVQNTRRVCDGKFVSRAGILLRQRQARLERYPQEIAAIEKFFVFVHSEEKTTCRECLSVRQAHHLAIAAQLGRRLADITQKEDRSTNT